MAPDHDQNRIGAAMNGGGVMKGRYVTAVGNWIMKQCPDSRCKELGMSHREYVPMYLEMIRFKVRGLGMDIRAVGDIHPRYCLQWKYCIGMLNKEAGRYSNG